jgi:4-amino-4-deoxy-L-arabinose transferase-like glycosyltransferase
MTPTDVVHGAEPVVRAEPVGRAERAFRPAVAVAALVGLALRVVWGRWVARPPQGLVDPARYLGYARAIADGHGFIEPWSGFPTAYYPPGYPWFLGIVTWAGTPLTDDLPLLVAMVQAVLGAASVVLGALVARRLAGPRAGMVAAAGLALYPNLIFHAGAILGETLYITLFLTFLVVGLGRSWPRDLTNRRALAAGVVLGLAVMVRPISLAVLPLVVAVWWWSLRDRGRALRVGGLLVAGVAVCIVPWTIRNAIRLDAFVVLSTNTGDNLCIGHAPDATGAFSADEWCATDHRFLDGPPAEVGADQEKTRRALEAILEDPGREPWLLWRRFWFMWVRDGDHDGVIAVQSYRLDPFLSRSTEARLAYTADVAYWLVLATGLVGTAGLLRRRRPEDVLLVGAAVLTALVPLAFFGDTRFKVPVIPLLIIAAATLVGGRGDDPRARVRAETPEPDGAGSPAPVGEPTGVSRPAAGASPASPG